MAHLDYERIQAVLQYDPLTGSFSRKTGKRKIGWLAHGYINIGIDGQKFRAHRLAWILMTGAWPDLCIDHINGDRADNRWENLRLATSSQNQQNRHTRKDSRVGLKGVTEFRDRWKAQIKIGGRQTHLGMFESKEDAHLAYQKAALRCFGEYARFE